MKIINRSQLKTEFIKEVFARFVEKNTAHFLKNIYIYNKNDTVLSAYYCPIKDSIHIWVGLKKHFPVFKARGKKKHGYLSFRINSPEEAFIVGLTHEARHCWQNRVSNRNWKIGECFVYMLSHKKTLLTAVFPRAERDADVFSKKVLMKWRKIELDTGKRKRN